MGRNFRKFFKGLPELLRLELIGSYAIIKEPEETTTNWEKLSEKERLRRVVDYLYLLRRNTFTHEAKIVPTLTPNQGVSGWVCAIHHGIWDYAVYLSNLDEVRGEVSLLRIIAVGAMRKMLGFSSDQTFLDLQWEIERYKRLFRQIYAELVQNERISFIYLRDDAPDLIDQPRRAMWRFKDGAAKRLQKSPEINLAWFGVDDAQIREALSNCLGTIAQINGAIVLV